MRRSRSTFACAGLFMLAQITALFTNHALAHPPAHEKPDVAYGEYIANEGVLVVDGETKLLFDPLFHNGFNNYRVPSEEQRAAMLQGAAPFDGVDMVFISHAHGDHFSATDMLIWLNNHPDGTLVAPQQAMDQLKDEEGWDEALEERLIPIDLDFGDKAVRLKMKRVLKDDGRKETMSIAIDAVRIPHAGWPGRKEVQNIIYRVTLNDDATIMHLGDADPDDSHYAPYDEIWNKRQTDLGFPPYWFFSTPQTHAILKDRLNIKKSIGVHVPENVPPGLAKAREEFGISFFSEPGEWHPVKEENEDGDKQSDHDAH